MDPVAVLRKAGYEVVASSGNYCRAYRDYEEVLFRWQNGSWVLVG